MFINRTYERTEQDDYTLNIQPILDRGNKESVPIFHPTEKYIVGWKIQNLYE